MRAASITELGRLPEIGEAPDPVRSEGEALIRVAAVPLNPIDVNVGATSTWLLENVFGCGAW